jgi:hypothetical protein
MWLGEGSRNSSTLYSKGLNQVNIAIYINDMETKGKRFLHLLPDTPDLNGLTQDGKDWLTNACDPFHDVPVPIKGIPDSDIGDTVVQTIKQKVSITAPPSVSSGGGRWDVHIVSLPHLSTPLPLPTGVPGFQPTNAVVGTMDGFSVLDVDPAFRDNQPSMIGTVVAIAVPAGQNTFPGFSADPLVNNGLPPPSAATAPIFHQFDAVDATTDPGGMSKLISGGFEVHNDTAELYLGGNVTCYHSPQSDTSYLAPVRDNSEDPGFGMVRVSRAPPANVGDATFYPNSRSWSAKEGVVMPFYLDTHHSCFEPASTHIPVSRSNDTAFVGNQDPIDYPLVGRPSADFTTGLRTTGHRAAKLETCGAYFTGLTAETVLTLDVRFTIERRPAANNKTLLSLASPAARLDEQALKLYTEMRSQLPVAAPVSWNETGKWWQTVLSKVGPALTKISPFLPGPLKAIAAGGGQLANMGAKLAGNEEFRTIAGPVVQAVKAKRANKKKKKISGPVSAGGGRATFR